MITEKNIEKAKQLIKNSKDKTIKVLSQDHDFNRKIIEYGKFQEIVFPNPEVKTQRKLKYIEFGLDRVSAKAAAKNNIKIVYDFSRLINLKRKEKALELEKLLKMLELVKKHAVSFKFINAKNKQALTF